MLKVISGKEITIKNIQDAIELDKIFYKKQYCGNLSDCINWINTNHDIYIMIYDEDVEKIIAYTNIMPITKSCYQLIKKGNFIDVKISKEMILKYLSKNKYYIYCSSIVVHPDYQKLQVFNLLFNSIISQFICFKKQHIFIKKLLADAVSLDGERFCKLFGMEKIKLSNHNSKLYEMSFIPLKFKKNKLNKMLYELYKDII